MSIGQSAQNGQNVGHQVTVSNREARALGRIGVSAADLQLPAVGLVLSEQQQAFVAAYVQSGGDHAAAAQEAEYPEPAKDGRALLRLPSIQAGVRREQAFAVAGLVHLSDRVLGDILKDGIADPKVKIAAARVAYERAGTIKRAQMDAEREAGGQGALAGMSVAELERTILEAEQRLAAASKPVMIDVTPIRTDQDAPHSAPIAPGSGAPPVEEGRPAAILDRQDTVSGAQGPS